MLLHNTLGDTLGDTLDDTLDDTLVPEHNTLGNNHHTIVLEYRSSLFLPNATCILI